MRVWWRKRIVLLVRRSDSARENGYRYAVLSYLLVKETAVSAIEMPESSPYHMRYYLICQCNKWLCKPLR